MGWQALLWCAAGLAILNWLAAGCDLRWLIYFTKPAVMLLLAAYFALIQSQALTAGQWQAWLFLGGALCGLAGDVLLMLPENYFLPGLAAFLAGHLLYIAAFSANLAYFWPIGVIPGMALAAIAWLMYRRILTSLVGRRLYQMRLPILAYICVLTPMTLLALLCLSNPAWPPIPARLAALGGLCFLVSDGLLAWDRFVQPLPLARPLVMATYHLAQAFILIGAAGVNPS